MQYNSKLKGQNVYLQNDLTVKEREIQRKIREEAERERKKCKKGRAAYQKLVADNNIWLWNKEKEELQQKTGPKN